MSGSKIAAASQILPTIAAEIGQDPALGSVVRYGMVDFSDDSRTRLPLSDLLPFGLELIPGGAKKFLTRGQASYLLRTAAPAPVGVVAQTRHQIVAQTRHQIARELIEELTGIDAKIRAADKQLRQLVAAAGSSLV